jgi:hypothetical protein
VDVCFEHFSAAALVQQPLDQLLEIPSTGML